MIRERTWLLMLFPLLAYILHEPALRAYHDYTLERPLIHAEVKLLPQANAEPLILYRVTPQVYVRGEFDAWTVTVNGYPICNSPGPINADPDKPRRPIWLWSAFFNGDCDEPAVPYRVCVQYDVRTEHGLREKGPKFCSDPHDPRELVE